MTMPERLNDTQREKADGEALLRHAFHGEPLDPEVARRVRERGAEISEEIYREHGMRRVSGPGDLGSWMLRTWQFPFGNVLMAGSPRVAARRLWRTSHPREPEP